MQKTPDTSTVGSDAICRSIAIVDHSPAWQRWLERAVPGRSDLKVTCLDSPKALLNAFKLCEVDLLIVAYRLPDIDSFSWISALRETVGFAQARIIALVSWGDAVGRSMAVLAGANVAYRKGLDRDLLRQDVLRWVGSDTVLQSVGNAGRTPALPLFDPRAFGGPGQAELLRQRCVVLGFLERLNSNLALLRMACMGQDGRGARILGEFAHECRAVGALRACERTELIRRALLAGGPQPSEVVVDYFDILVRTAREMADWSLEGVRDGS